MTALAGVLVTELTEAEQRVHALAKAEVLALDTEGDGMFRYRTRLCTVQIAAQGDVHVFDTLLYKPATLFGALLGSEGPRKIVHDVSFDARVLHAHGIALGNVFDTSIAARFLGLKSTGLSSLLAHYFGLELPKHKQQADWGERPIDDEALAYLADDVRHLEALAARLEGEVRDKGIFEEVEEEARYMLGEAQLAQPPKTPFMRIKGAVLLAPSVRARLYELAATREEIAEEVDTPPTRLIVNDLLIALAGKSFPTADDLARALPTRAREYAVRFAEALARGDAQRDAPEADVRELTPRVPSQAELEKKKRRRSKLMDFRSKEAEARGVDLQVVLPGHCLSDLVNLDTLEVAELSRVPGFGACRVARYGARLVQEFRTGW